MLYKVCERLGLQKEQAFKGISYRRRVAIPSPAEDGQPSGSGFVHPTERDAFGVWSVPTSGMLSMRFTLDEILATWAADASPEAFLRQYYTRVLVRPSARKVAPLLAHWHRIGSGDQTLALDALSQDFVLEYAHVHEMCRPQERECEREGDPNGESENAGRQSPVRAIAKLLHSLGGGQAQKFQTIMLMTRPKEYMLFYGLSANFLNFFPENPTGRYYLNLGNPTDRTVAISILLLDRWESLVARRQGRADTSRYGNWSNIRNCVHGNERIQLVTEWRLPFRDDLVLEYASWRRPFSSETPVEDDVWSTLLTHVAASLCDGPNRVLALRCVSQRMHLKAFQLRELISMFRQWQERVDVACTFYLRLVDPQNSKLFRASMTTLEEWREIKRRLGTLSTFPSVQPEGHHFEFDLSVLEDRIGASLAIRMSFRERMENLRNPSLVFEDSTEFSFEKGMSKAWEMVEELPQNGRLTFTYQSAPQDRSMSTRKEYLRKYNGWDVEISSEDVLWWSTLYEMPDPVIVFLVNCMRRFDDAWGMFRLVNGPASRGAISRTELYNAVCKLGWKVFIDDPELLKIVHRCLDPDGQGDISTAEWHVVAQLWKELELSVIEFLRQVSRIYRGDLDQAFMELDADRNGTLDEHEFLEAAKTVGYFGPANLVFKFLSSPYKAGRMIVNIDGWKRAQKLWEQRETFFTDAKSRSG